MTYVPRGQSPVPGGLIGSAGARPGSTVFDATPPRGLMAQAGVEPSGRIGRWPEGESWLFWVFVAALIGMAVYASF